MGSGLSKTRFKSGLQCEKKLWLEHTESIEPTPLTDANLLNFDRGREVELKAREQFEDCRLIESFRIEDAANETSTVLTSSVRHITQAAFIHDSLHVRVDILQRNETGTWNLIEIKMSGEVKKEHIPDLAFQKYVLELCGLSVDKCFVLHLNKACLFPDLANLFTLADVTDEVHEKTSELPELVATCLSTISEGDEPEVLLGKGRCNNPHCCRFQEHCWKDIPHHSIFSIPNMRDKKTDELQIDSIIEVVDVPDSFKLSDNQRGYVDLIKGGVPIIDRKGISDFLSKLKFPLYFLDFEADRPPLPEYEGMHPFSLMPFQFSLHILDEDGVLKHHAFLHTEKSDCRRSIASVLDRYIGLDGNVIVYNKTFEKGVLEALAPFVPEYADKLLSIRDRLWDQLDIFKDSYLHPAFAGSNSLKVVLEVLVPGLSYGDLHVGSGDGAIAAWVKMVRSSDACEKELLQESLLEYCKLDSLAMVEIHKHLLEISVHT